MLLAAILLIWVLKLKWDIRTLSALLDEKEGVK